MFALFINPFWLIVILQFGQNVSVYLELCSQVNIDEKAINGLTAVIAYRDHGLNMTWTSKINM